MNEDEVREVEDPLQGISWIKQSHYEQSVIVDSCYNVVYNQSLL